MVYIEDNKNEYKCPKEEIYSLIEYGNKSISDLIRDHKNIVIYPMELNNSDINKDSHIFDVGSLQHNDLIIKTGNIVGFIGNQNQRLVIYSRFDNGGQSIRKNYFLQYLIQKNEGINLIDLEFDFNMDSIYDYIYLMFPKVLKDAMNQGLYKEYVTRNYNEPYIKGKINIPKFIKDNIPFNGRINYINREYTCNNKLFYLLRWTIEFMKKRSIGRAVLNSKKIKQFICQIEYLTQDYIKYNLKSLILINEKKIVSHPYYNKYKLLQMLCLKILKRFKVKYGESNDDKIYGCLFDVSILWEEYINTILEQYELGYIHSSNIRKEYPLYMFKDSNEQPRYIDFYDDNRGILIDTKYKRIEKNNRDDYTQMAAYMFLKKYKKSVLLYPQSNQSTYDKKIFNVNSYGGNLYKISMNIPNSNEYENYDKYVNQMVKSEEMIIDLIKRIEKENIE